LISLHSEKEKLLQDRLNGSDKQKHEVGQYS
jgi:hypothetical protein